VRRLIIFVAGAVALACASAGAPPGGHDRKTPPEILSISPESGATNATIKEVEFKFDEVVSDRPTGTAATLDQMFLISPQDGAPNVSWHRNRITIRPRKGFRPNTAYRVTLLPGLADLRGNTRRDGATILFSTGATFPPFSILGRVFDWEQERPLPGAYIEAVSKADTTLIFVAATDSLGRFDVGPLAAGEYRVRALLDQNSNRAVDPKEKWDTTSVRVEDTRPNIELDVIARDSLPPAFSNVSAEDTVTLRLTFDQPLDPRQALDPSMFRVQRSDSSRLQITGVAPEKAFQRVKAAADSIKRAATDTARRPPPPAVPSTSRPAPPPPKPRALPPETSVILSVSPSTPLVPGRYVISVTGLRSLVGKSSELRRGFTIEAQAAPRDTTRRPPADSTRRPRPPRPR
jgi:hypothetical protein